MFGDVYVEIQDGNLGRSASTGTGVHAKVGASGIGQTGIITIKRSMTVEKIKGLLGCTPLADACIDSLENGAETIYCIPVKAGTAGTVSEVTHTGEGEGTVSITGKPENSYKIIVEITETGALNAGGVRYSIDGGNSFSAEEIIPSEGKISMQGTGLELTFSGASFAEGDLYEFDTTAPVATNQEILDALESLKNFNKLFEFVHIVGPSTKALWASVAELANKFQEEYKKPLMFICESRYLDEEEDVSAWVEYLIEERKGVESRYLQVVPAFGNYVRMDGREQICNLAGVLSGLYGAAKESQSVGEVGTFPISAAKLTSLMPAGIEEYLKDLDEAGYCTFRQYHGLEEFFVTSANMFSPENSDFRYAEEVRVLNRLVRDIRLAALEKLQMEIDVENLDASLAKLEEELNVPIDEAVQDQIISSGRVSIDAENLNILVDEELKLLVTYVPKGHIRNIRITIAASNPYTA